MRKINRDNIPHIVDILGRAVNAQWYSFLCRLSASWWGVDLGQNSFFNGFTRFRRHPGSRITIGSSCRFNSLPGSNLIGVNRPCMLSTLTEGAVIEIGSNCGLSGTVIGCASKIVIGNNVKFGSNTLVTDTDWHTDDSRTSPDKPVKIENGVWLGVNVTVLKGVTIGENTLVAAGSLVTRSLPANVIAAGSPAKPIRQIDNN